MPKRELKLNYKKCARCRKDRQNCTPKERRWPEERCDRCMKYGFSCSKSRTAKEEAEDERKLLEERGEVPQRVVIRPYKELLEELDCLSYLQRGIDSYDVDFETIRPFMSEDRVALIEKIADLSRKTQDAAVITAEGLKASKKFSEARILCEMSQTCSTQYVPWKRSERFLRGIVESSRGLGMMFDALDNQGALVKAIEARLHASMDPVEAALSSSEDEGLLAASRMELKENAAERQELDIEITNMVQLYAECGIHLMIVCRRLGLGDHFELCHPLLWHALSLDCIPLIKRSASMNQLFSYRDLYNRNALHFIAKVKSGSSRLFKALGRPGEAIAEQDILDRVPLLVAYKHGNLPLAKNMLVADLSSGACAYLSYGVYLGHALGNLRVNALQLASLKGYFDEAKELLRLSLDPNEFGVDDPSREIYGITALQAACAESRCEIAQLLVKDSRINVNATSMTLEHPLIIATRHGDRTVIEKLIDHYSTLEKRTTSAPVCGKTTAIVRGFLAHGANPNVTNRNGWTPLMFAVLTDEIGIIKTLLENKADPNIQNENGWTALMMAARSSWKPEPALGAKVLVDHGADTNVRNNRGETAYDVAKRHGMTELYELLFPLPNFAADPN